MNNYNKPEVKHIWSIFWRLVATFLVLASIVAVTFSFLGIESTVGIIESKPSIVAFGVSLLLYTVSIFYKKGIVHFLDGEKFNFPNMFWFRINKLLIVLFLVLGVTNLVIAFSFSTEMWIFYKHNLSLIIHLTTAIAISAYCVLNSSERSNN
jgi:intracellular septation protein A